MNHSPATRGGYISMGIYDSSGTKVEDGYHFVSEQVLHYEWQELEVVSLDINTSLLTKEKIKNRSISKSDLVVKKNYSDGYKVNINDYEIEYDNNDVKIKFGEITNTIASYVESDPMSYSPLKKLSVKSLNDDSFELYPLDKNSHSLKYDILEQFNVIEGISTNRIDSAIYVDGIKRTGYSEKIEVLFEDSNVTSVFEERNNTKVTGGILQMCVGQNIDDKLPSSGPSALYNNMTITLDNGLVFDTSTDSNMSIFSLDLGNDIVTSDMSELTPILKMGSKTFQLNSISVNANNEHTFSEWTVDSNATCTANGSRHRDCSVCGKHEAETLNALGHNYSSSVGTVLRSNATCESASTYYDACTRCGTTDYAHYHSVGSALGHNWVQGVWRNSNGWYIDMTNQLWVCSTCGAGSGISVGQELDQHGGNNNIVICGHSQYLFHALVTGWGTDGGRAFIAVQTFCDGCSADGNIRWYY